MKAINWEWVGSVHDENSGAMARVSTSNQRACAVIIILKELISIWGVGWELFAEVMIAAESAIMLCDDLKMSPEASGTVPDSTLIGYTEKVARVPQFSFGLV